MGLTVCIRRGEERTFASQRGRIQARNEGQPLDASKPRKTKNRAHQKFQNQDDDVSAFPSQRGNRMHSLRHTVEQMVAKCR